MREIVLAEIASLFCKKHYGIDIKTTLDINVYNDSLDFADQILSLPVEGFEVKEKCPQCDTYCIGFCSVCAGEGFISRHLTLGELPEQARKMREALKFYSHAIAIIQVESCPTNTKDNPYKERRIDTPRPNVADDALTFKDK